jgi:hypothetical protein
VILVVWVGSAADEGIDKLEDFPWLFFIESDIIEAWKDIMKGFRFKIYGNISQSFAPFKINFGRSSISVERRAVQGLAFRKKSRALFCARSRAKIFGRKTDKKMGAELAKGISRKTKTRGDSRRGLGGAGVDFFLGTKNGTGFSWRKF